MIISRTPFRISFAGGGTDLPSFCSQEPGAVVSTAINKYMYVSAHPYFENRILLKYSKTELVRRVSEIRHPLVRESMRLVKISGGIEIASAADIAAGTGLGSSSSFTVGLLHALHAFSGHYAPAETLASQAIEVEIDRLGEPVGKQDQTIAAHGGFQYIEFLPDGRRTVTPIICPGKTVSELEKRLLLFYTGQKRSASAVLKRQGRRSSVNIEALRAIKALAERMRAELQSGSIASFGEILHEGWVLKKGLASGISNGRIDRAYAAARRAGASGGKVLGAGGGGFLLLFAEPSRQAALRRAMASWREIAFRFEAEGSKIVYVSG